MFSGYRIDLVVSVAVLDPCNLPATITCPKLTNKWEKLIFLATSVISVRISGPKTFETCLKNFCGDTESTVTLTVKTRVHFHLIQARNTFPSH